MSTTVLVRTTKRFFLTALVLSAWMGSAWGQEEQREQYVRAYNLYSEKKYDESRKILDDLWTKAKTHDVATLLGQLEKRKNNHVEAARYFAIAASRIPPTEDVKKVEVLRKWCDEEKKRVATYDVTANIAGATLSVDGVNYGVTPLETPLFVTKGRHLLLLTLDGYKGGDAILDGVEGGTQKLELKMEPIEKTVAALPPAASSIQPPQSSVALQPIVEPPRDRGVTSSKPNPWILVGGGAIAVGGLVTGLVFNSMANSADNKANGLSAKAGEIGCTVPSRKGASDCEALKGAREDYDRNRNVSTVALAVGGTALVGAVMYWLWPRKSSSVSGPQVHIDGTASREVGWVGVTGRF